MSQGFAKDKARRRHRLLLAIMDVYKVSADYVNTMVSGLTMSQLEDLLRPKENGDNE